LRSLRVSGTIAVSLNPGARAAPFTQEITSMGSRLLRLSAFVAVVAAISSLAFDLRSSRAADERTKGSMFAHMVFFDLKDSNAANRQKLVEACNKYLSDHPGTSYYSAGARADEMDRDVNDTEFDVALHLVFADKASYDKYAVAPRHLEFIEQNKDSWKKVRVFDSYVKK
jgi:hypothetical protein